NRNTSSTRDWSSDVCSSDLLVVSSPTLQEGKTTTIVNLALTMAQSGQKTLLVGANMRRPSIHRFFGIEREPGLSNILVGSAQWQSGRAAWSGGGRDVAAARA